jgi:RimJ/RimL family protein N-acetyltransferase
LIQIKHQRGRIILFREGKMPAEQFAGSKTPGAISLMPGAADYSVVEHVRDGRPIEIRALRPDDKAEMLAAIGRTSPQSLQRRFFAPKKGFSEQEMAFFLKIDFENHVALVAQIDEDGRPAIAGGGRYIVVRPGQAEIAFVVVDAYQSQGIGTTLMHHLAILARDAGLRELIAEVLPENTAMLKVFKKFGFQAGSKWEPQVIHLTMQLA